MQARKVHAGQQVHPGEEQRDQYESSDKPYDSSTPGSVVSVFTHFSALLFVRENLPDGEASSPTSGDETGEHGEADGQS